MEEVIRGLVISLREPDIYLFRNLTIMINIAAPQSAHTPVSRPPNLPPLSRHRSSPARSKFPLLKVQMFHFGILVSRISWKEARLPTQCPRRECINTTAYISIEMPDTLECSENSSGYEFGVVCGLVEDAVDDVKGIFCFVLFQVTCGVWQISWR